MRWLKLHTEARNDAKLESLPDDEFRVWFRLLCLAGDQPERGAIEFRKERLLALEVARGDVALLQRTLASLVELDIIEVVEEGVTFAHWNARQYDKPSDMPEASRERQQRSRAARRDAEQHSTPVTPLSRDVTPGHALEGDTEQIQIQNRADTERGAPARTRQPEARPLSPVPKPQATRLADRANAARHPPAPTEDSDWLEAKVAERALKAGVDPVVLLAELDVGRQTERWQNRDMSIRQSWRNWMDDGITYALKRLAEGQNGQHNGSTRLSAGEKRSANAVTLLKRFESSGSRGGTDPPALPEPTGAA